MGALEARTRILHMTAAADITTPVVELKGHKSKVDLVAFHPSVEVLASVAGDNEIKLWDLTAAAEAVSLPGSFDERHTHTRSIDARARARELIAIDATRRMCVCVCVCAPSSRMEGPSDPIHELERYRQADRDLVQGPQAAHL